jgi:hypothetical protein
MTTTNKKRVGLYARVSTKNNGQDPETQLIALREYANARGFMIAGEYVDMGISGAKDRRPELDRLMADARRRKLDAILVARFDRFARSTKHLVLALEEFQSLGIDFISLNESIDTSTPMGRMVFTVIARGGGVGTIVDTRARCDGTRSGEASRQETGSTASHHGPTEGFASKSGRPKRKGHW